MTVFQDYSRYYDLFYRDKDYPAEAQYVHELVQKAAPGAATLLDLGCGTGGHAFPFSRLGYRVHGVDLSEQSLRQAREKQSALPEAPVCFSRGDIRTLKLGERFDAVVALFHVMSYQTRQEDLRAAMAAARAHLAPGGVFVFDFWHGPGVLSDPPSVVVRRAEDADTSVVRISEPSHRPQHNVVDVRFTLFAEDKRTGSLCKAEEIHSMRYLFEEELREALLLEGLRPLLHRRWMSAEPAGQDCWNAVMAAALDRE